jgi:hypothetical protein
MRNMLRTLAVSLAFALGVAAPARTQSAADDLGSTVTQRALANPGAAASTDLIVTYRGQNGAAVIGPVSALPGGGSSTITAGTTATSGFTDGDMISSSGSKTADSGVAAASLNRTAGQVLIGNGAAGPTSDAGLTYTGAGATDSLRMPNAGTGPEYGFCGWTVANIYACGINTNGGTNRQFQIVGFNGSPIMTVTAGSLAANFGNALSGLSLSSTGGSITAGVGMTQVANALAIKTAVTGNAGAATITGTAPAAAGGGLLFACGTSAGTGALYAGAGTSTTYTKVLDNIGSGVTGC